MAQKIKIIIIISVFLATMVFAESCYYDKAELLYPGSNQAVDCGTVPAKFNANVLPLITSKCNIATCHDASAAGGIVLQNYAQVSGEKFHINHRVIVEKSMPPTGPLLPAEINILKCWIESGAPNN